MKSDKIRFSIFIILFLTFFLPKRVYAYLDPGTGSYIIQLIIGGLLGSGYLIKTYWKEIKNKFQQLSKRSSQKDDQDSSIQKN